MADQLEQLKYLVEANRVATAVVAVVVLLVAAYYFKMWPFVNCLAGMHSGGELARNHNGWGTVHDGLAPGEGKHLRVSKSSIKAGSRPVDHVTLAERYVNSTAASVEFMYGD